MNKHFPFKTLPEKISWIKANEAEITNMHSIAGGKRVSWMVRDTIKRILNKEPRESILHDLRVTWSEIQGKHPEINSAYVRESIFWYLDGVCTWVKYEEFGMDEIKGK